MPNYAETMTRPNAEQQPPMVMSFGASDATGGAGIQCDALTLASMGCHPLAIVCAVAVCDTRGLDELVALDAELVAAQARAVLEDIPVQAFKLGMAGSVENLAAIAEILSDYPEVPLVVEPALGQIRRDEADADEFLEALLELVLPQATILVASRHDVLRLAGGDDGEGGEELSDEDALGHLAGIGVAHVLLTGAGDPGPQVVNRLYGPRGILRTDAWERLGGHHFGARATLAAALAASLAHGMDLPEAVREAQEFTWQALGSAFRPGMGRALPDRMFWMRPEGGSDA